MGRTLLIDEKLARMAMNAATGLVESGAAVVDVSPDQIGVEQVKDLVKALPLEPVIRGLAMLAAQQFSDGLQAMGLRPADYAFLPGLPEALASRIAAILKENGDAFSDQFRSNLAMRG